MFSNEIWTNEGITHFVGDLINYRRYTSHMAITERRVHELALPFVMVTRGRQQAFSQYVVEDSVIDQLLSAVTTCLLTDGSIPTRHRRSDP